MTEAQKLIQAIRCCRADSCNKCPVQEEDCDFLQVAMECLPRQVVRRIENELERQRVIVCPHCGKRI